MQGYKRKIIYVGIYEGLAISICSFSLSTLSGTSLESATFLSVTCSAIAAAWNFFYTTVFEAWESRQIVRGRSFKRRLAHAVGFETGLLMVLVPLIALWLKMTLIQSLAMNFGLAVFFLCYTFCFNWVFDRMFGLPASARA